MRPGLLRAVTADRADVEPVALGEGVWNAGFDFGSESGKNGEGGCDKRSNSEG